MAVKKHKLVPQNQDQVNLATIVEYIQPIVDKPVYMPPADELIETCEKVVRSLSRVSGTNRNLRKSLRAVEKFLLHAINNVDSKIRHEIVTTITNIFYTYISDPSSEASPATSVVLVVMGASNPNTALTTARWLVQQNKNDPSEGLKCALSCLYRWLSEWHSTSALGNWILCFINVLEENEMFNILIDVSVQNIANLFEVMISPILRRPSVADVILHVLVSLRESEEAFERISHYIGEVLETLAADNRQLSRQLLGHLVDVLTAMKNYNMNTLKGVQLNVFREKYNHVIKHLERHMATNTPTILVDTPWRSGNAKKPANVDNASVRKVGLENLGNTCYINSVMQALFLVHQFSNYTVLNMFEKPYWAKMSALFVNMMHTVAPSIKPTAFVSVAKPDYFVSKQQHDSSEFLGHLFELLTSYEESIGRDCDFNYNRPAVLNSNRVVSLQSGHGRSDEQKGSTDRPCTSSQRPESSGAAGPCRLKRHTDYDSGIPAKRRLLHASFCNTIFAGVFLTRIKCMYCGSSSRSKDIYRDLQLAFPEKAAGNQYTIQALIDYYFSKEILMGENQYKCRDCNTLRDAEKSVIIEATPKILIIILKTFKYDTKLRVQTKLMHSVMYNTTVTLPTVRTQQDHNMYNLFAAVIHAGTTLNAGHYYTLGKDHNDWYIFDDSRVKAIDDTGINRLERSHTPYMLFYRRKDVDEGVVTSFENLPKKMQETVMSCNKAHLEYCKTAKNRP